MSPEKPSKKLASLLAEMAVLLELKGESPFKCRAYANAAKTLDRIVGDLHEAVANRTLMKAPGIGKGIFEKIARWVETGTFPEYEALKAEVPQGLLEMLKIRGLGAKKVRTIYERLQVADVGDLEYACIENRLAALPGFGAKIQAEIQKEIAYYKKHAALIHAHTAREAGATLLRALLEIDGVVRGSLTGTLRRRNEVVEALEVIISSDTPERIDGKIAKLDLVDRPAAASGPQMSLQPGVITRRYLLKEGLRAVIHIVPDDRFPFLLHYYTGSRAYHRDLADHARRYGIRLSRHGLFLDDHLLPCADEAALFSTLELDYIPPELREGRGEVAAAAAHALPQLVDVDDIRGVFHIHTTYSDGAAPLADMVAAAEEAGFEYVGISDHSQTAYYANGLKEDGVRRQHQEIDALKKRFPKIAILKGIESDILPDGRLDYPDPVLARFDFVIASVHARFKMSESDMTRRIIRAIRHPAVTILGHPTGRLLLSREGYPLDIPAVIRAAAAHHVAIEINASPYRLDLDWRYLKLAKTSGVRLSLNPDAHRLEAVADLDAGVGIARKGWLAPENLLNTLSRTEVAAALRRETAS